MTTLTGDSTASVFRHTPYYCEENVYMLCKRLCESGKANAEGSDLFVIFISNEKKQIPMWHQKASGRADGVVLWDYHVICFQRKSEGVSSHLVWDLDSSLTFPSPISSYISQSINPSFPLFSEFQRCFRIVHAPIFLGSFASDRRHMKDSTGNWISEPPAYNPIVSEDGTVHNLNEYIDIQDVDVIKDIGVDAVNLVYTQKLGVVVSETQLEDFLSLIT